MDANFGYTIQHNEGAPLGVSEAQVSNCQTPSNPYFADGGGMCGNTPFSSDCYFSNNGQSPYISDVYREFLMDGTRYQKEPMETQYPLIFKMFFSEANIRHIQGVIRSRGFNAAPDMAQLSGFMNQIYTDDMPYGAYNIIDPQRTNKSMEYTLYYLRRLNNQLLNRVLRNMSVMKSSRLQYLRDISGFQAPLEITRPIYTECKGRGPPLDMSTHLLPPPPDGRQPTAYQEY